MVSLAQLREAGLDLGQIRYRRKMGRLHLLHRGVYALGHAEVTLWGHFMAAVLAVGAGAMLSHRSAAVLWGLLRPEPTGHGVVRVHYEQVTGSEDQTAERLGRVIAFGP